MFGVNHWLLSTDNWTLSTGHCSFLTPHCSAAAPSPNKKNKLSFGTVLATIKDSDKEQCENCAKFHVNIIAVGTDIAQISVNLPPQKGWWKKIHQISLRNEVKA